LVDKIFFSLYMIPIEQHIFFQDTEYDGQKLALSQLKYLNILHALV